MTVFFFIFLNNLLGLVPIFPGGANVTGNIAVTEDGGKTWKLVSEGKGPGYLSSIRYVPGRGGNEIVGAGPGGISYSIDGGENWETLSTQGFHTIRFVTDSTAYAGGNNRIAKLKFK